MQREKNLIYLFASVLVLAFAVKIYSGYHLRNSFLERGNSKTYLNAIAFNLVLNNDFSIAPGVPSVDYEPLYPFVMSVAYRLSGPNWLALTIIQLCLHALTSILIFLIATKLWDLRAGVIAGIYHTLYPYLFTYGLSVYDTTLFVLILVAIVYFTLIKNTSYLHFAIAGILMGLAFLTRATIITFIPPLFIFLLYTVTQRERLAIAFRKMGTLVLLMVITMAPWLLRNHHLTGRYVISTHGSFGLWQGNNYLSADYLKKNLSLDNIYRRKPPLDIYARYPLQSRAPLEAVKVADAYQREAVQWITSHPADFVSLAFLKAQKLWTWNRNPSSSSLKFGSNEDRQAVNFISYLPLLLSLPLGLYLLYRKNKPVALVIAGILFCFTGAHMIAIGFTRARVPIDFFLMICLGIFVSFLLKKFVPAKEHLTSKSSS